MNISLKLFKLPNCEPCSELSTFLDTVEQIKPMITTYITPDDLPMFKQHRVSGAPQLILMQGHMELHRARGYDACVDLINRIIEDDY